MGLENNIFTDLKGLPWMKGLNWSESLIFYLKGSSKKKYKKLKNMTWLRVTGSKLGWIIRVFNEQ